MEFKEKFIAFIDVLGFKEMVKASDSGEGKSVSELLEMLKNLGTSDDQKNIRSGQRMCPESHYEQKELDFIITQVSDCAVISSEISPAGVINLVAHCSSATYKLLHLGVMCRGYITRGRIHHTDNQFVGTGYQTALSKEPSVSVFKSTADEKGTPFIEVDQNVCKYIDECQDQNVKKMFKRMVKSDETGTAIFPFQLLGSKCSFGGNNSSIDINTVIQVIQKNYSSASSLEEIIMKFVKKDNQRAMEIAKHYVDAIHDYLHSAEKMQDALECLLPKK